MYQVYVLLCADNTLYTGVAKDLEARISKHKSGEAAKYTRARLPVRLVYSEPAANKSEAMKREWEIKSWSRSEKIHRLKICITKQ